MNYSPAASSLERARLNRARKARASVRQPGIRRGAAVSAGLHALVLLAVIVVIPQPAPPAPPEETVAVEWEDSGDSAHAQKGEQPGKVAAPTAAESPVTTNPAIKPPDKAPLETAPPPPPPPPPPPVPEETIQPPDVKALDIPKPSDKPAAVKPPPPKPAIKPPPKTVAPPVKSTRNQPNVTKNPAVDTRALDNTLEKFLTDQPQIKPPTHRYNPERGGRLNGGGSRTGGLTGELSNGQRKQIGDDVRRCYSEDTAARDYATYSVIMTVTIDAAGEAHEVKLSDADQGRANADPAFRAFAERAERAVLDPNCAKLPVPAELLGKPAQDLMFRFRP